jgi:phosphorylated adapter RNA export protein
MDTFTADTLAEALQEPKKSLLAKVLRTLGEERCQAIFTETLATEASGGMLTKDGTRQRTPGGTFFHLVRSQCSKQERARLFPYQSAKKA